MSALAPCPQINSTDYTMFISKKVFYKRWKMYESKHMLSDECREYGQFITMLSDVHVTNIRNRVYPASVLLTKVSIFTRDPTMPLDRSNLLLRPHENKHINAAGSSKKKPNTPNNPCSISSTKNKNRPMPKMMMTMMMMMMMMAETAEPAAA